jgi:hypothetical protein
MGAVARTGNVLFSLHARQEMRKDGIGEQEVFAILRGGIVEQAELERGTWRYRVHVARAYAVVALRPPDAVVVVTAWRKR